MVSLWRALFRRKSPDVGHADGQSKSPLARVLSTLDLTALGVGSTLGVGVYVLAGSVARDMAGPAVILSFAVAAVASVFAGLCYAEFGARVPLAGSAYIYSYVSIGEFLAFVIGWNLIMEYVIGCASVARGLSNYLDQLMDNTMQTSFERFWHIHVDFLSPYFDFFAFGISFILSVVLALGVKESMALNNLFTLVNMSIVLFVIIAGSFKADISNWQIDPSDVPSPYRGGQGGFFPFGAMGVLKGAATCFYGFVGFDCIATTGEEVRNPQKAIPVAIIVSLLLIFLSYFGVSSVLTLMWPYYKQDADAPLPYVFEQIGWPVAQWIVAIGGIFGLFASLFGAMYPLPRVIYAMANDGLLFRFLGEVHPRYKTPLIGTLLAGLLTGLMAALFKLQQLVNMLSIGTLMAYTIVATCVLILRYKHEMLDNMQENQEQVCLLSDEDPENARDVYQIHDSDREGATEYKETTNLVSLVDQPTPSRLFYQLFNWHGLKSPTPTTCYLVNIETAVFCCLSVALSLCLVNMERELEYGHLGPLMIVCILAALLLLVLLSISLQPTSKRPLAFKVPLVPVIPALSIVLNTYLMLMLDVHTWIRFAIWMAIGVGVYFITMPFRKLSICCEERGSTSSSPALGQQVVKLSTRPASLLIERKLNGLHSNGEANAVMHDVEAAGNFTSTSVITVRSEIETQESQTQLSMEEGEEVLPIVQIKIQCPTPRLERLNSEDERNGTLNSIPNSSSDIEALESNYLMESDAALNETESRSDEEVHKFDGEIEDIHLAQQTSTVYKENEDIHLAQQASTVYKENEDIHLAQQASTVYKENEDIHLAQQASTVYKENEDTHFAEHQDTHNMLPDDSLPIIDKNPMKAEEDESVFCGTVVQMEPSLLDPNNPSLMPPERTSEETQLRSDGSSGIEVESVETDNESECDVKSLYPNVVVISSSEEDVCSEISFLSSINDPFEKSDRKSNTEIVEPAAIHSEIISLFDGRDAIQKGPSQDLNNTDKSGSLILAQDSQESEVHLHEKELDGVLSLPKECNISEKKPLESTSLVESAKRNEELVENEVPSTPLKNVSFVEKLERIIQDQAEGLQNKSSKFHKAYSLSDIPYVHKPSVIKDQFLSSSSVSVEGDDKAECAASVNVAHDQDNVFENSSGNPDSNVEDIRKKLEKIFSTRRNHQTSSLTVRNSHIVQLETQQKTSKIDENFENSVENAKLAEARRKMADVLGTIRQRNKVNNINVKDLFNVDT